MNILCVQVAMVSERFVPGRLRATAALPIQSVGSYLVIPDLIDDFGSCLPVEKGEAGTSRGLRHPHGGIKKEGYSQLQDTGFPSPRCFHNSIALG